MNARDYLLAVKDLPCAVCGEPGPSDAHHPRFAAGMAQKSPDWLAVPLCKHCHQGPNGIHGDRSLWKIYRIDEPAALASTIEAMMR